MQGTDAPGRRLTGLVDTSLRAIRRSSGVLVAAALSIYGLAVTVNAQVKMVADWWPYPWLWGLVVLLGLVALSWIPRPAKNGAREQSEAQIRQPVRAATPSGIQFDNEVVAWEDTVSVQRPGLIRDGAPPSQDDRREVRAVIVKNNGSLALQNTEVQWLNPGGAVLERRIIEIVGPGNEKAVTRPASLAPWGPMQVEAHFIDRSGLAQIADQHGIKTHAAPREEVIPTFPISSSRTPGSVLGVALALTAVGFIALAVGLVLYPIDRTLSLAISTPALPLFMVAGIVSLVSHSKRNSKPDHSPLGWAVIRTAQGAAVLGFFLMEISLATNQFDEAVSTAIGTPGLLLLFAAGGVALVARMRAKARKRSREIL